MKADVRCTIKDCRHPAREHTSFGGCYPCSVDTNNSLSETCALSEAGVLRIELAKCRKEKRAVMAELRAVKESLREMRLAQLVRKGRHK